MKYDPLKHHRRSIRLKGYDYAQPGAYFVTVCVQNRECALGEITDGEMQLNAWGQVVHETWSQLPAHYPHVVLDMFVIMPNHMHGIIVMGDDDTAGVGVVGAGLRPAPTPTRLTTPPTNIPRHGLPEIVRAFKSFSARRINELRATPGTAFWQRNYYEHIVRDASDLARIRAYIQTNPGRWALDQWHPAAPTQTTL